MRISPWFWHLVKALLEGACRLRLRRIRSDLASMPASAVLICAKHASGFDIPVLADVCWRGRRARPYFQMGSFVGYRLLGPLVPLLQRLGGFSVMRPKEVLRLKKSGLTRDQALQKMQEKNEAAEDMRRDLLRSGEVLVVFPEGTRDPQNLRELKSEIELRSAIAVAAEGKPVTIWPVMLAYGSRRLPRRKVIVQGLTPFRLDGASLEDVLARVTKDLQSAWVPPESVDVWNGGAEISRLNHPGSETAL